jgi:hypothetical protein
MPRYQSTYILPSFTTVPDICSSFALHERARIDAETALREKASARPHSKTHDRYIYETEQVNKSQSDSFFYCPYHTTHTAYLMKDKCDICLQNFNLQRSTTSHSTTPSPPLTPAKSSNDLLFGHPDHRHSRLPYQHWYPATRNESLPQLSSLGSGESILYGRHSIHPDQIEDPLGLYDLPDLSEKHKIKLDKKRSKSERVKYLKKYPYTWPRIGTDTTYNTYSGRIMTVKREGWEQLARKLENLPNTQKAWIF